MAHYPQPQQSSNTLASFDSVPLFMQDLPDEDPAGNIALEALQSLVFEGTPDEQARNFKEQGNEYFRGKRYREAAGFYTQGIDIKPTDQQVREALLLNRAACNLELRNFGSVLRDTSQALLINNKSTKGYFRASAALVALERYAEALDVCDRCLVFDSANMSIRNQRDKVLSLKEAWDAKEAEKAERLRKDREAQRVMNAAFQALHLTVLPPSRPQQHQYEPHFDPSFSGLRTSATPVLFPVFLLYPQHNTSDLITSFDPSATFSSHIATMFPPTPGFPPIPLAYDVDTPMHGPDWDSAGEYTTHNLAVYAATVQRRLLKIGKRMTLRDACDAAAAGAERDGLELRDGAISFFVVPKGERERAWVEEWKRKRAAEGQ